jgi:hypothetical protein
MMKKVILIITISAFAFCFIKAQGPPKPPTGSHYNTVGGLNYVVDGEATAHIIQPISINKTDDLKFGNLAAGTAEGSVTISVFGHRTATGGATLISAGNVSTAAAFNITGHPDASFTISLPLSITISSADNEMEVDNFVSSLGTSANLNGSGAENLKVGATLNIKAHQVEGIYTGSFNVTIAYN